MNTSSLYQKYSKFFPVGTCVTPHVLTTHHELLKQHYNSLTAENHMKFGLIHPQPGQYDFAAADKIVNFAREHDKSVRGHTLVWHNQNPDWLFKDPSGSVVNRITLLTRMKQHIDTVVSRYHGKIGCWDVVNEVLTDTKEGYLRQTPWLDIIGPEFIEEAFLAAHQADPSALLFYNDYNETSPDKCAKICRLIKDLQSKDVPIHGVGLQAHWNIYGPTIDAIKTALDQYATLGIQIQITELDISMFKPDDLRTDITEPSAKMQEQQAIRYEEVFAVFREYAEVITNVTFWGAADDLTWLHDWPAQGRTNWPLLFDHAQQPKAAFERIINF